MDSRLCIFGGLQNFIIGCYRARVGASFVWVGSGGHSMQRLARPYLIAVGAFVLALNGTMVSAFADGPKPVPDAVQTAQALVPPDPDPWRIDATLYGWLVGVSGNVTARGQTIDTNASFLDLVQ